MPIIPTEIKDHISNANYYLQAADKFPHNTFDAGRILLLLIAWENIQIAEETLHSWAQQTTPARKLYTSHAYKFRNLRKTQSITHIIIYSSDTKLKTKTIEYSNSTDFEKLLQICRYGPKTGSKKLESIFEKGWFFDDFRNTLISKIKWEQTMINVYESYLL